MCRVESTSWRAYSLWLLRTHGTCTKGLLSVSNISNAGSSTNTYFDKFLDIVLHLHEHERKG